MSLLKRENWWICLLLMLCSNGAGVIVLGALLDCLDKDAWYAKGKNWLIGLACFVFPFFIMLAVFSIQMLCQVAAKLKVAGSELYLSPYIWIICFIVPIFGWIFFYVMLFYLIIWIIISLYRGAGEKYIK